MNLTSTKTKNYEDCMKEMSQGFRNSERELNKQQQELKNKKQELEKVEKKLISCDQKKNKAVDVLETAHKSLESLRVDRQDALSSGKDHKVISQKIKEKREEIELFDDTVIGLVNISEGLGCDKDAIENAINTINTLITELTNRCEAFEAVIKYNEVCEKLAPAYKKVVDIIDRDSKEGRKGDLQVYHNYNGGFFSNAYIRGCFQGLSKLYVDQIIPDIRNDKNEFLPENLWHFKKS